MIAVAAAFMGMLETRCTSSSFPRQHRNYNVVFILATVAVVQALRGHRDAAGHGHVGRHVGGGMAQALMQWPALRREGYRHQFVLDRRDPALREVLF
jgi:peptidoglycan biosynthesis protein MviN/MurJ (putative lipid II flippase)